jgi:hypothetical protein
MIFMSSWSQLESDSGFVLLIFWSVPVMWDSLPLPYNESWYKLGPWWIIDIIEQCHCEPQSLVRFSMEVVLAASFSNSWYRSNFTTLCGWWIWKFWGHWSALWYHVRNWELWKYNCEKLIVYWFLSFVQRCYTPIFRQKAKIAVREFP